MTTARLPTLGLLTLALCLGASATPARADRRDVGRDHPILERFPGAVIVRHDARDFDVLSIPLGRATGIDRFAESTRVEGKITRITYEMPQGHSTTEVFRSYRDALVGAGFELLYSCEMEACGEVLYFQNLERPFIIRGEQRYLAARAHLPRGEVYVTVRVYTTARQDPPVRAMVNVAEVGSLREGLVEVDAEAMAAAIGAEGHVALYGIYFETDEAELEPASEPTLDQMAEFLQKNPNLEVYIVGHTDNVGTLEYNLDLSQRRAEAVFRALVARRSGARTRLVPRGVGPLAPVASNRSEAGRARNRRVELVEAAGTGTGAARRP